MRSSWADAVESSTAAVPGADSSSAPAAFPSATRPTYVPPHLRNRPPSAAAPAAAAPAPAFRAPAAPFRPAAAFAGGGGGAVIRDFGRLNLGGRGGGWNNNTGGWDRRPVREANPFAADEAAPEEVFDGANTGINFDAYEDIPVETSGDNVPPPVSTFNEIDLGEALNLNIQRCKYTRPTPVQRHAIPISLAGRDLMACAQTGSGKTAAFCFPIISGILTGQCVHPQRGARTAYPLALILAPTRELSVQINEEAKKFAYQTGVRVVVVYGGAPVGQQIS